MYFEINIFIRTPMSSGSDPNPGSFLGPVNPNPKPHPFYTLAIMAPFILDTDYRVLEIRLASSTVGSLTNFLLQRSTKNH